jgi:hypothetical protein
MTCAARSVARPLLFTLSEAEGAMHSVEYLHIQNGIGKSALRKLSGSARAAQRSHFDNRVRLLPHSS